MSQVDGPNGIEAAGATETLKRLAEIGLLEWIGSSPHDPKQYYRTASKK